MGNLDGINVNKIDGGLGRLNSTNDDVVLLVSAMPITGTTLVLDKAETLIETKDIEALGVNAAFDANEKLLPNYHVSEIFRLAPDAICHFLPVAEDAEISETVEKVIEAIKENPQIKGVGFVGFSNTLETISAVAESLQVTLVEELKKDGIYLDFVLLEGGSTALALNAFPD